MNNLAPMKNCPKVARYAFWLLASTIGGVLSHIFVKFCLKFNYFEQRSDRQRK